MTLGVQIKWTNYDGTQLKVFEVNIIAFQAFLSSNIIAFQAFFIKFWLINYRCKLIQHTNK